MKLGFFLRVLSAVVMFVCIYLGSRYGIEGVAASIVVANVINIAIKVGCLAVKTNTPMLEITQSIFTSWRSLLPILLVGTPFLLIGLHSWVIDICFAGLFALIVIVELGFFPNMVGQVYTQRIYPMVEKIKHKILK